MNTKIFKAISITVILAIAVSLLLTSSAYAQNSVSFSGDTGSTFKGEGSSASVGKACSSSDDPVVSKEAHAVLYGPGYDHQCDCGSISAEAGDPDYTADDPYMFVEVDCEQVDASVRVRGAGGFAYADAGISAWAEVDPGDPAMGYVSADIWAYAYAESGPGTAKAKADAKADGRAHAELNASGYFYDSAVQTADAEGVAEAHAGSTNRGSDVTSAFAMSGIWGYGDTGYSLSDAARLHSDSYVEGAGPRSVARADGSAEGTASASGYLSDEDEVVDWSAVSVEGTATTHVSVRGEADADSSAEAYSLNSVEEYWYYGIDFGPFYIETWDDELFEVSQIGSDSYADVYGHRSSAKATGYVSADTYAAGMTWKPDVWYDSFTGVSGEAGSGVSVVKEGSASSEAGAIALSVVDGYVYVEYDWMPVVDVELDMLDVTALGSMSMAEGESFRTRVYTHDWVDADTYAGSSMFVEDTWPECPPPCPPPSPVLPAVLADSATSGRADQVIKGKGLGLATSAAGAGAIAASNVVDWFVGPIAEDFAAVGIGTYVDATDGSMMYPMACLSDVDTSAATYNLTDLWVLEERVSAEITDGSGNSWLNPRRNLGDSVVSGALVLSPDGTVETDVDKDLDSDPNYAYGYLAGYSIIEP